jgi:hypothetical protein
MKTIELRNATIKNYGVLSCTTRQEGSNEFIHLEIFPKNYKGGVVGSCFGASEENPTINIFDLGNTNKKTIYSRLLKMLQDK